MNLIGGISALGALANGAANVIREMKRPRVEPDEFATMLKTEVAKAQEETAEKVYAAVRADQQSERYMQLHDLNADGLVSFTESGFSREAFDRLDTDGNGALSHQEVRQAVLAQSSVKANATNGDK